jgi:GNAT superfamily N-acetyltransferase
VDCHLRPASESDRDFLYALHCTTMRGVIEKTWGWDEAWQRADFERRFAEYIVSIIEAECRAAGSLWLEWKPDSLYIHELQVVPEMQGRGIGTAVLSLDVPWEAQLGAIGPSDFLAVQQSLTNSQSYLVVDHSLQSSSCVTLGCWVRNISVMLELKA